MGHTFSIRNNELVIQAPLMNSKINMPHEGIQGNGLNILRLNHVNSRKWKVIYYNIK